MASFRLKGQECEFRVVMNNQLQQGLLTIKSGEVEAQMDILREGYLGETTDRKDDVFRGARGKLTIHIESGKFLDFVKEAIERSRRRQPGTRFSMVLRATFGDQTSRKIYLQDIFFGAFPISVGGRDQYVETTVDFECSEFSVSAS